MIHLSCQCLYGMFTLVRSFRFIVSFYYVILRIPFESKNPFGFLIAVTLQYIIVGYELSVIACMLSLGIGAFMFAIASTEEINRSLNDFNKVMNGDGQGSSDNRSYFLEQFSTFIVAHSTVKQLRRSILHVDHFE